MLHGATASRHVMTAGLRCDETSSQPGLRLRPRHGRSGNSIVVCMLDALSDRVTMYLLSPVVELIAPTVDSAQVTSQASDTAGSLTDSTAIQ